MYMKTDLYYEIAENHTYLHKHIRPKIRLPESPISRRITSGNNVDNEYDGMIGDKKNRKKITEYIHKNIYPHQEFIFVKHKSSFKANIF